MGKREIYDYQISHFDIQYSVFIIQCPVQAVHRGCKVLLYNYIYY